MGSTKFACLVLALMFISSYDAGAGCRSLEDDAEIEEEFRHLNKPTIRTVETEYGEIYDCVDFYDQPAFDHPLLKDHKHEYRQDIKPANYPETRKEGEDRDSIDASIRRVDCPNGTVPIRRMTKEQYVTAKMQAKVHARIHSSNTPALHGFHVAIVRTKYDPRTKYNGGGMSCSVEQIPSTNKSQYSRMQMKIQSDPDVIQVGWMVNPSMYNDKRTHGFIFLKTSTSSCFNVLCPGFILTRHDLPIDGIIEPVSRPSGPVYYKDYRIYRDKASGNWNLQVGRSYTTVGYWPSHLFTGLAGQADYIDWGGEAYSDPDIAGPPMGRGVLPSGDLLENASVKDIVFINEAGDKSPATGTEAYADKVIHYGVKDGGISKQPLYHYFTYGGPGGATGW